MSPKGVVTAVFGPDGKRVVTASQDGTVRTWVCDICGGVHDLLELERARRARVIAG